MIAPSNLNQLNELIDPTWISQALQATGKSSIRRRKLPAELVVWLIIGLALFRNQPSGGDCDHRSVLIQYKRASR